MEVFKKKADSEVRLTRSSKVLTTRKERENTLTQFKVFSAEGKKKNKHLGKTLQGISISSASARGDMHRELILGNKDGLFKGTRKPARVST